MIFEIFAQYTNFKSNSNLSRKSLSAMQWASENLPSSFYYSSGDDDMMIDVAALDDNIMKAINTTSHLPYFPFICIFMVVGCFLYRLFFVINTT